jgi:cysteine-rich repeat protein
MSKRARYPHATMERLYIYCWFAALLAGAATGMTSCVSLHCSTNLDVSCADGDICSLCNDRDQGCRPRATVTDNCVAFPDEDDAESASSSDGDETSTGGESHSSGTSGPGASMSASAGMTSSTTTTTNSSTSNPTNSNNPFCGNGEVELGEECDDQNFDNDDFCVSCTLAFCGDGHVGPEEECDDQNYIEDDGCNNVCARDRVAFVTSGAYNGKFGGFVAATNICRGLAFEAGFENPLHFYPWLSDSEYSPSTVFFRSSGRYVLPDMVTVIADSWDDLTDGTLQNAIDTDESEVWFDGTVTWTNTLPSGAPNPEMNDCGDWSLGGFEGGAWGFTGSTDFNWTDVDANSTSCGNFARLYCFEQA